MNLRQYRYLPHNRLVSVIEPITGNCVDFFYSAEESSRYDEFGNMTVLITDYDPQTTKSIMQAWYAALEASPSSADPASVTHFSL